MGGGTAASERSLRRRAWIGLTQLPKWGTKRIWEAVGGKAGDPIPVWQRFNQLLPLDLVTETLQAAQNAGATVITWDDMTYPTNLRPIPDPPPVLFVRGELLPSDALAVALVGSRRASEHGLRLAYLLGQQLAQRGLTVVSGLATGIDTAAHAGALDAKGRTIAVVGAGVDVPYPRSNILLAERIRKNGAILSEFSCGTPPRKGHFPVRNKTLAGLALGTCVVEAGKKSGALITARLAGTCNRVVMTCPGDVLREHTRGSNELIQDGAMVILSGDDCLLHIESHLKCLPPEVVNKTTEAGNTPWPDVTDCAYAVPNELRSLARQLWLVLAEGAAHPDEIAVRVQSTTSQVTTCLTHLLLHEYVEKTPGGLYALALAPESASMVT